MKQQQYANHRRYYIPHHFIFLPLMSALVIIGFKFGSEDGPHKTEWLMFAVLAFSILYLAIMLRQHYALGNQDRIVRLEFRLRYFELFGKSSSGVEKELSTGQIAALRFANDEEFKVLLEKTLHNKLSADDIKRAVTDWQADTMRL